MPIDVSAHLGNDPRAALRRAVPPYIFEMSGSQILQIADEVRSLIAEGREVVNLTVGDFSPKHFSIPKAMTERIAASVSAGETNYPPAVGIPELREAIASFYARDLGVQYDPEGVVVGSGARPVIYGAWRLFTQPGDRSLSFVPAWNVGYYAALNQTRHTFVPTTAETNFHPTVEQVADNLEGVTIVVINSPLNPTGTAIDAETLEGITRAIVEENERRGPSERPVMLLYDQVYWMLTAEGTAHANPVALVPESAPYVVSVDAISKSFAATGLRLGWAVLPPYLKPKMGMMIGHTGAWAPRPVQVATAWLLDHPDEIAAYHATMKKGIFDRLRLLYEGLDGMKQRGLPVDAIEPQGGIYLSFRVVSGKTNEELRRLMLNDAGVAVVPFQAFDLSEDTGWFRMSVGAVGLEEIPGALERLEATLRTL